MKVVTLFFGEMITSTAHNTLMRNYYRERFVADSTVKKCFETFIFLHTQHHHHSTIIKETHAHIKAHKMMMKKKPSV